MDDLIKTFLQIMRTERVQKIMFSSEMKNRLWKIAKRYSQNVPRARMSTVFVP